MSLTAPFLLAASISLFGDAFKEGPPPELPAMRRYEPPAFPPELRATSTQDGYASAAMTVDAEGRIEDVVALEASHPAFASALTTSIREWRLEPAPSQTTPRREVVRFLFMRTALVTSATHHEAAESSFKVGEKQQPAFTTVNWEQLADKPARTSGSAPAYPAHLKHERPLGQVAISYVIDQDGVVRVPVVMSAAHPGLGDACLQAVKEWRFTPATHQSRPVLVEDVRIFNFGQKQ